MSELGDKIRAWVRHGEAVPSDVTTYDRATVHMEVLPFAAEADRLLDEARINALRLEAEVDRLREGVERKAAEWDARAESHPDHDLDYEPDAGAGDWHAPAFAAELRALLAPQDTRGSDLTASGDLSGTSGGSDVSDAAEGREVEEPLFRPNRVAVRWEVCPDRLGTLRCQRPAVPHEWHSRKDGGTETTWKRVP